MLFETRYFWAVFTAKNQDFTDKLKDIFERSATPFASSLSIYEVYKLTLSREGRSVAELRANTIKKQFKIAAVTSEIAEAGAEISYRVRVPMADALIMATARKLRLPCVTDDPHFTEVKRVWV